ncbi:MAG: cheW3 [Clostridia bacterium]|jgi:purine-binding chemotaxis protein CheW|nr:cheW3 [Clostridia bacterium]
MAHFENNITEQEDAQKDRYLTFALDSDFFGIEIKYVTEIIGIQPITIVPDVPKYIKGIINLRGKIIVVIDMRTKFHKNQIPYNDRTCIIVVTINDVEAGLIVDQVSEVVSIPEEDIVLPPNEKLGEKNKYIKGMGKTGQHIKLIIDGERLLEEN